MNEPAWTLLNHPGGVTELRFDLPGEKVNKFTLQSMQDLSAILTRLAAAPGGIAALVVTSGKPGTFIAGADIHEIERLRDPETAAASSRAGQEVFGQLAALPFPTVAAVGGACMGGGTELALACDWRLMSDSPKAKMGLPEVRLGILPGWGGCQRLPRLIGLAAALDMILTGKSLDGRRARRIGLADEVVPHAILSGQAVVFARAKAQAAALARAKGRTGKRVPRGRGAGLQGLLLDGNRFGRDFVLRRARAQVLKTTRGHYPAPFEALTAVETGIRHGMRAGLEAESRGVGKLLAGDVAHHLVNLFWMTEEIKKETGVDDPAVKPRPIRRIAVIGAGTMGGGIAQLAADKDLPVRLKDVSWKAIGLGLAAADKIWARQRARKRLSRFDHERKRALITATVTASGLGHCDLAIEAVVENMEVKKKVLAECEERLPAEAIFATNTSSLSVTELASAAQRPERVAGLHFFNPVDRMPLVEVIAGAATAPETVATLFQHAKDLGKTPVVVKDSPGFLVNRILMPYMNEAVLLVQEGAGIAAIDAAMTGFGMPMGPLELMDEVGIDVGVKAGAIMAAAFRDRLEPATGLQRVYESGRYGKKNQRGFYTYANGKRGPADRETEALLRDPSRTASLPSHFDRAALTERMVLLMINEAALCLEEAIVASPAKLDLAMIFGTGFPPFRGGLLRYADALGAPQVTARLDALAATLGKRFTPAPSLRSQAASGVGFYLAR